MTGGGASGRKGAKWERRLVQALGAAGWFAMRAPSSGSATEADLPDVFAMRYVSVPPNYTTLGRLFLSEIFAIELKSGKNTTLYVGEDEVDALRTLSTTCGASPLLGVRFTSMASPTDHFLLRPQDARRTDGGNYGLPEADIAERAAVVVREDGEVEVQI